MSTRSEALKKLVTSLGWEPESDTVAGLVTQLSQMVEVSDGGLSIKEAPAYVARINRKGFESIGEAVSAAKGRTVTLAADLATGFEVPKGARLTLDLNGHSITSSGAAIINNGDLTIKGEGVIESTASFAIVSASDATTTIESGTVRSVEGAVITGKARGSRITIMGGSFFASDNAVIAGNGSAGFGGNYITITGGHFEGAIKSSGYVACGIYAPTDDHVTVTGGTFDIDGGCGICARAGRVVVTGGTFSTTGSATGKVGDSRVVVPCSAIVFDAEAAYPALSEKDGVTIHGGHFTSDVAPVSHVGDPSHIAIYSGSFSADVPQDCCAIGYEPFESGGTHTVRRS